MVEEEEEEELPGGTKHSEERSVSYRAKRKPLVKKYTPARWTADMIQNATRIGAGRLCHDKFLKCRVREERRF